MADAAIRRGLVLCFGLQRRALPSAAAAQAAIAQGRLGEIYHARAVFTRAWGAPKGAGNWFRDPARAGGCALLEQAAKSGDPIAVSRAGECAR